MKFSTLLPVGNTPRWFGRIFKYFPRLNFRTPPPLPTEIICSSKNLVMIVNYGVHIALMFFETIQVDDPIIKRIMGV